MVRSKIQGNCFSTCPSVIYVLKLRSLKVLNDNRIQWLTIYEMINALWKEAILTRAISPQEASEIVKLFAKILEFMKILSPAM